MSGRADKKRCDEQIKAAYEEHYYSIYRYCLAKLKDNNRAEDAAQDTYLVLYNKLLSGVIIGNIKAYLMKTASNIVLKQYEDISKSSSFVNIDEVINIPSQNDDVEERLTFEEYSRQISAALSDDDGRIFNLRYIDDLKIEDISEITGMSVAAVTTRLSRMRKKLQKLFEK